MNPVGLDQQEDGYRVEQDATLTLSRFIEGSPLAAAMFDRQMRYLAVSQRWRDDYALGGEPILGRAHYEAFPEISKSWRDAHLSGLKGEVIHKEEDRIEWRDGRVQWLRWLVRPWNTNRGDIGGTIIYTEDITARKQAEQALRDRESKLEAIIGNSPSALSLKTPDGRYALANPNVQSIHHLSEAEIIGKTDFDLYPEETASAFRANDERVLRSMARHSVEELVPVGGIVRNYISHVFPIPDEAGAAKFICRISLDITDRKRVEREALAAKAELFHASRLAAIGEVASTISHEVNQPLGAVLNFLQAAQMHAAGDSVLLEILEKARVQARRASETVRRVKSFASTHGLNRRPETLRPLVEDACSLALLGPIGRGVRTLIEIPVSLPPVLADRIQIQQVVLNLVRNAAEAMRNASEKSLSIKASTAGSRTTVEIVISDSGPGIPAEIADKLFKPFATTKPDGTGLGLSTSRSIMLAHDGQLDLVPSARGAAFRLILPIAQD